MQICYVTYVDAGHLYWFRVYQAGVASAIRFLSPMNLEVPDAVMVLVQELLIAKTLLKCVKSK